MNRFVAICLLVIAALAGTGLWRGWWGVSTDKHPADGKAEVSVSIDTGKVSEDATAIKEQAKNLAEEVNEEVQGLENRVKDLDFTTRRQSEPVHVDPPNSIH